MKAILALLSLVQLTSAYQLSSLPADQKNTICSDQKAQCNQVCALKVTENICDTSSMAYRCVCADMSVPSPEVVSFPVPFLQCQGSHTECVGNCKLDQKCQNACDAQYVCDKIKKSNVTTPETTGDAPTDGSGTPDENSAASSVALPVMLVGAGILAAIF